MRNSPDQISEEITNAHFISRIPFTVRDHRPLEVSWGRLFSGA
jgi:hypothetical protein